MSYHGAAMMPGNQDNSANDNTCWEISPSEAHALYRSDPEVLLLDCRTRAEFEEAAIEGALLIPLQQISSRIDELEPHRNQPIIVYCRSGKRSMVATKFLSLAGFLQVRSMAGGYQAWRELDSTRDSG